LAAFFARFFAITSSFCAWLRSEMPLEYALL